MEYNDKARIARARRGKSPCKPPFCTGAKCYRNPLFCTAWEIYNQHRKEMSKHDRRSKEKDS